jgi:signal transduction histidine kinase
MMLAMGAITIVSALIMIAGVILGSRHEATEHDVDPNAVTNSRLFNGAWVIDSRKTIVLIILFVIGIIVATGVIAWLSSRREIAPMQEAMRLQRNFIADASHELKTPLAVIGARTDLLEHRLQHGKDPAPVIAALRDDVTRMDSVITDLLLAAQGATRPKPTDLIAVVRQAVATVELLAERGGVTIRQVVPVDSRTSIVVMGGHIGIARCLVAVLDNAIAHSPTGSAIEVIVGTSAGKATVTVRDHGSGIEGDPERLFTRFARADVGSEHQGYGLGLALARDIASRYRGRIDVVPVTGTGTALRITLPLAPETPHHVTSHEERQA